MVEAKKKRGRKKKDPNSLIPGTSKYVRKYGMTLSDIAEKIGVSVTTAHSYLRDRHKRKVIIETLGLKKDGDIYA